MFKAKAIIAFILVAFMVMPVFAKKTKTADYKDNVLTDLKHNFTLDVPKNWKTNTFKENPEAPALQRALLIQKNYRVNQEAKDLDADFTIPEIQIYVCPATMTPAEFMTKLKSDVQSHSSDNDIISKMNLVLAGEFIGSEDIVLAGEKGVAALYKRPWERHLQADPDDPRYRAYGGRIVRDVHDVHEIYAIEHKGYLYIINAIAEVEFYQMVSEEFAKIIYSMKFQDVGDTAAKE